MFSKCDSKRARLDISDDALYTALASRRASFDQMAWQVPIISFTAQAFLLTTALGPDSSSTARYFAAGLSFVVSALSMLLMARHRQADNADAMLLSKLEKHRAHGVPLRLHGNPWRRRRNNAPIAPNTPLQAFRHTPVFLVWEAGLFLFALAALAIVILTICVPDLLANPSR
jgi:hypothetical protein